MSDPSDKKKSEGDSAPDLSSLQGLSFGPDWSESARTAENRPPKSGRSPGGKKPARDRRPDRPPRRTDAGAPPSDRDPRRSGGDRRHGDGPRRGESGGRSQRNERRSGPPPPFQPVVDVAFYPEDAPFKALCHAMRSNCRTYELFDIARLILEKPERFVVVLHPKPGEGPAEFFISVPDGLPFASEDQAITHVIKNHLDRFVETEAVEVDPPTGNFPIINRCGLTGELIGPPNYHRYQSLLHEHHAVKAPNMPFEKFQQRIESVRDEAVVQEWMDKMKKITRYRVKPSTEGDETETFDSLESLKFYLVNRRRSEIVRTTDHARFSGRQAEALPDGPIRNSIFGWREQQQRFPLETANNLRGRLRRMHFTIYKRGAKGASFVCAVKRKFRTPKTRLAESLQELIDFIEKHPNIEVSQLPEQFLGIEIKTQPLTEISPEKAPDIEAVPEEEAAKIVEVHEQKRAAKKEAESQSSGIADPARPEAAAPPAPEAEPAEPAESAESAESAGSAESVQASGSGREESLTDEAKSAPDSPADARPAPKNAPSPSVKPILGQLEDPTVRQMMFDLRWLVTEGYVTEFGDGRLFAAPPMEEPPTKDASKPAKEKANPREAKSAVPEAKPGDSHPQAESESPKEEQTGVPEDATACTGGETRREQSNLSVEQPEASVRPDSADFERPKVPTQAG